MGNVKWKRSVKEVVSIGYNHQKSFLCTFVFGCCVCCLVGVWGFGELWSKFDVRS